MARIAAALASLAALVATSAALGATPAPSRTVPCAEIIDTVGFPYAGSSDPRYRRRTVLGAFSVAHAYIAQVTDTGEPPWRYWTKWGLVVRADLPTTSVTVPKAWRKRAAIIWGNGGHGEFAQVRLAGCGGDSGTGHAYAGGVLLRDSSACVPLVFSAGGRSQTVRFGIGRRCP